MVSDQTWNYLNNFFHEIQENMKIPKSGKFKAAYLNSSLLKGIDRERLYSEQKYIWDHARFEHYRYFSAMPGFKGKYISTDENGFRTSVK